MSTEALIDHYCTGYEHHGYARFSWCLRLANGDRLPEGLDFVTLAPAGGRISRIVGFFGPTEAS